MVELDIPELLMKRIEVMYEATGYETVSEFIVDATHRRLEDFERLVLMLPPNRDSLLRRARVIVPQSEEREHLYTPDTFTADTDLETRFVAMVLDTHGQVEPHRAHRWTTSDFHLPPEERPVTMQQWTLLRFQRGKISRYSLERWDLPTEWLGAVGSHNPFIPDPLEQAEEIFRILREETGVDIPEEFEPIDVVPNIDPEKPVYLNLREVSEVIGVVRYD